MVREAKIVNPQGRSLQHQGKAIVKAVRRERSDIDRRWLKNACNAAVGAAILLIPMALSMPVSAYDRSDLEDLLDRNSCVRCDLRGADLEDVDLRGADLEDADLRGADLEDANLRNANLRDANLRDADLRDANLRGADLRDADLRDARLRGANLDNARINRQTRGIEDFLDDDRHGDRDYGDYRQDRDDRRHLYEQDIDRIYREVLGRRVDRDGLQNYTRLLERGESLQEIRREIARSREAGDRINEIYRQVLGRDADEDGLRHYRDKLEEDWDIDRVQRDIERSDEARDRGRSRGGGRNPFPQPGSDRQRIEL